MNRTRLLGAFFATALGVTAVALSTLLFAAGRPEVPHRFAAAPIVVQSPTVESPANPFPPSRPWSSRTAERLAERLAAVPGVAAAVPDRTFYAQPILGGRPHATVREGHGWSSVQLGTARLVGGTAPTGPNDVVLDRALGLAPGAPVTLLTATGPAQYRVTGVLDGPGIYLADPHAATLAPGVRAIGLLLRPDADVDTVATAARRVLSADRAVPPGDGTHTGDARVLTGAARGELEPREDARTRWIGMQALTGTAALAGFVAVFVVASTFAFNVAQRRRELGLLRTIGATPGQVRRMLYREALAVGGAAAVTGVAAGAALAPAIGALLVDVGFEPASYSVRLSAWPIAVSLAVGPVVALLGVWVAARRAARVHPLEALREAEVQRRALGWSRWAVGGCAATVGIALSIGTATADDPVDAGSSALYAAMALVVAAAVLGPAFVPGIAWLVGWLVDWPVGRGALGLLVREHARAATRRTAATAAPVLLTVSFAVLISGLVQTSVAAYASGRAAAVNTGYVVVPDDAPGLSDAAVSAVPGAALLPTTVYLRDTEPTTALGVDPATFAAANNRLSVYSGSLADLDGADSAAVTRSVAERLAGERLARDGELPVTFADGETVRLRIVAVVSDRSIPAGLLLPRATVRMHDRSALTSVVFVADPVTLPADTGARVVDTATYAAEADRHEDRLVWMFTLLLIGVSAGYGALAVANTLLLAAVHRTRELYLLRLAGATIRQVSALVVAESTLVVAVGAVLGGGVAGTALVSIRAGLAAQVGAPVALVVPWPVVGGVVGGCLLLATAASLLPARLALRRPTRVP